jgi:hypothetical protein
METEGRLAVTRREGSGDLLFNGDRVSILQDGNVLDGGDSI